MRVLAAIFGIIVFVFTAGCSDASESGVGEPAASAPDGNELAHNDEAINLEATRVLLDFLRKLDVHHRGAQPRIEINLQPDGSARDDAGNIVLRTRDEWEQLTRLCRASLEIHGSEFMIRSRPANLNEDDYGDAPQPWYTVELEGDSRMTWIVVSGPEE